MQEINADSELGMLSTYMPYSEENLEKMRRFKLHICELLLKGSSRILVESSI